MSFTDYYHLFSQKKECSWINDTSLINCLKRNINYVTQFIIFFWWISEGKQSSIFYKHVQAFTETDEELQQLKHCQSCTVAAASAVPIKLKIATTSSNHSLEAKIITVASTIPVISAVSVPADDFMNLSSAIAAVQSKSIFTLRVKEICNKWKLCYYCKLQHSDKNAKKCLNKKSSTLCLIDIDDTSSVDGSVPLTVRKI